MTLLVAQPLVFFRSVLFANTRYIPFDIGAWQLPLVLLIGNLPQGRDLFYWLQTLIPFHMILGGIFTYIFVRRLSCSVPVALFAGTTYQLSAFFASQAQHLGAICCGAWFPLILICVQELGLRVTARWIGLTAIAVALEILAGFPASTAVALISAMVFAGALAGLRVTPWRSVAAFICGIGLGACIGAVLLIPAAQASGLTIAKLRGDWHARGGGLPLQSLASFVWPNYYHVFTPFDSKLYQLPFNFTFLYTYCGHLAALFILFAPILLLLRGKWQQSRLLVLSLVLTLLSAVWMIGESTPVYTTIYTMLPKMIRGSLYSEMALMSFSLWVAVTAALTLGELGAKRVLVWLAALAAGVNLIAVSSNRPMNTVKGAYQTAIRELQRLTRSVNPPLRIDFFDPVFWPFNTGAEMYRVPSAIGDRALMNLRYYYLRRSFSGAAYWDRTQFLTDVNSKWIDAINDGYLIAVPVAKPPQMPPERFEPTALGELQVWRNKSALPRFYLVDKVRHASSLEEARDLLPFVTDPSTEAVVENLSPEWSGAGRTDSSVRVVSYTNNRIELDLHTTGPSYLVTSEAYYPGWTATLNRKPAALLATKLAFRGMPIPPGDSRVEMTFRPEYLALSIVLSVIGLGVCIGLLARNSPAPATDFHEVSQQIVGSKSG